MFNKTEKQKEAIKLLSGTISNILLYGGSRSGKSAILIYAIINRAIKEKSRHVVLRQHFNHVKQSIVYDTFPKIFSLCFPEVKERSVLNKSDWFYLLPNGSEIWFSGLDSDERTEKILGTEFSTIFFNECSQITYNSFNIARTRLAEKNNLIKKIYCDTNPPRMSHWSYQYFIDKVDPVTGDPLKNAHAIDSLSMNPCDNLEHIDEEYVQMLEGLPPLLRARFLEGKWGSDETDIFRAEWIRPSDKIPSNSDLHTVIGFIDPAVTEKARETENSCESSIIHVGIDYNMDIHELETLHGFWSYGELKKIAYNSFLTHSKGVSNYIMGVEDVQAQRWLGEDLNEMEVPIEYVRPDADKIRRAISITDLLEKGKVRINDIYLRRQLLGFPGDKLKDCVDAVVHALRLCRNYIKEAVERDNNPLKEAKIDEVSKSYWEQVLGDKYEEAPNYEDFGTL